MTREIAGLLAVAIAINAIGYWAFADDADFIYTLGEATLAYGVILGAVRLVMEIRKPKD